MKVDSTGMNDPTTATSPVDATPAPTQTGAVRSATTPATGNVGGRVVQSDTVTVSDTASRLSVAIRDARPPADTDPNTISALRHAARTGSLAIDIVSLANDILSEEGRP